MSQIRSRVKTVVDYEEYINSIGVCCETDGTKTQKTFSDCLNSAGAWTPNVDFESFQCAQPGGRGFCCSCAYATKNSGDESNPDWADPDGGADAIYGIFGKSNGIRGNISKCECEYNNGNWSPIEPLDGFDNQQLCAIPGGQGVEGRNDVRFGFACCHCVFLEGEYVRTCSTVCNAEECRALSLPDIPDCESVLIEGSICNYDSLGGQDGFLCGTEVLGCTDEDAENYDPDATVDDGSCYYDGGPGPGSIVPLTTGNPINYNDPPDGSNPFELRATSGSGKETENKKGSIGSELKGLGKRYEETSACCTVGGCIRSTRLECEQQNGFFIPPDAGGPVNCSVTTCPKKPSFTSTGNVIPPTIKQEELPEVGEIFAGGVYMGVFNPGISQVKINLETGLAEDQRASEKSGIGSDGKWALIMCLTDLGDEFSRQDILYQHTTTFEPIDRYETSTFDGLMNTFGASRLPAPQTDLFKQIRNYNRFSFRDWYLPSIQELGFAINAQRKISFKSGYSTRFSQNKQKLFSYRESNYENIHDTELFFPYLTSTKNNKKVAKFSNYPAANLVYSAFAITSNLHKEKDGLTMLTGLDNKFKIRLFRRINIIK